MRSMRWFEDTLRDLELAARGLFRQPAFTLTAALVLAAGIAATSTAFSLVNAFVLRPLPVRDGAALTLISVARAEGRWQAASYPDYVSYREQTDVFEAMTGYTLDRVGLSTESWADPIVASYVPGNFFDVLGVGPAVGRVFVADEGVRAGADPIVVLGFDYWRSRFGGDAGVVGRTVRVNGRPFTVVGVARAGFAGPYAATVLDAYLPIGMRGLDEARPTIEDRQLRRFRILARPSEGVSMEQAQSALDVVASRLATQYPETNRDVRARIELETRMRPDPETADSVPSILARLMGMVGLVLLTACFNVANMLTVRAIEKDRQLAIRTALGANRWRLVRLLMSESVCIASIGGVVGCLLATWMASALSTIRIPGIPAELDFTPDWRVYAFVAAASAFAGLVAGLVPSWRATRASSRDVLAGAARGDRTGGRRHGLRDALVALQLGACLTLLVTSGLFVKSLLASRSLDLGFDREQMLLLTLDPSHYGYGESDTKTLFRDLVSETRSLPGVDSAAHAGSVPLGYHSRSTRIGAAGYVFTPEDRGIRAGYNVVGTEYFSTMRIPLLRGRLLEAGDGEDSPAVAVINEAMAETLWPGADPIGRRFEIDSDENGEPPVVVGVVANGKYFFLFESTTPFYYLPFEQSFAPLQTLHVRSARDPETLAPELRAIVHRLAPDVPIDDLMTMDESLKGGNGFLLPIVAAAMASALGALSLLLASVGLYGVVSYVADTRRREISIRMAIGANRGRYRADDLAPGTPPDARRRRARSAHDLRAVSSDRLASHRHRRERSRRLRHGFALLTDGGVGREPRGRPPRRGRRSAGRAEARVELDPSRRAYRRAGCV